MLKNILLKCLTIIGFGLSAQAFQVTYGFPNVDPTTGVSDPGPYPTANGIQLGAFTANGVSSAPSASGRFSFTNWPSGALNSDDNFGNFTGALSPMSFYRFTIHVFNGYTLNLNSIEFSVRRSGTGPRNYSVRCNKDNFSNNLSVSTGTNTKLSVIPTDVFFWNYDSISTSNDQYGNIVSPGTSLHQISDSVTFHFYAWNAESPGGSFSIDNVKITGLVKSASDTNALGIKNIMKEKDVLLYPNPITGEDFFVRGTNIHLIQLSDFSGSILFSFPPQEMSGEIRVDIGNVQSGMYLITVHEGSFVMRRKIFVQRSH
ncbi:MAG: T9SS type A sorting domain-containing protein [Bacteroidia bacterium]|nr:T9SS type A sorting domain-containing protein [Bacteroidia bacterium]